MKTCPYCASDDLVERPGNAPHPHFGRVMCLNCGRQAGWMEGPLEQFRLPFGKHKGKTLAQVAGEDRSHLEWIASNAAYGHQKIQDKVRRFLASLAPARMAPAGRIDAAAPEPPRQGHP